MALASSSTASLAYKEEAAGAGYGVVVAGAPAALRMTGEDLSYDVQSENTKEINSTRQVTDSIIVGAESGGGINLELSYREYDPFLEALLASTFANWGTDGVKALTVTINVDAGTVTDDGVDGFAGLAVGQWFSITGAATNNGVFRIASNTDDVITVDAQTPFPGAAGSTEASVAVSVSSCRMQNGVAAMRSFSMEKKFADVSQFFMFTGMVPSSMSLDFATASIVSGNFGFLGKGSTRAAATQFTAAPTASKSYGVMNAVTGVGAKAGMGAIIARDSGSSDLLDGTYVQSMKLSINAGVTGQKAIGVLGNAGVRLGTFQIGGSIDVYLADGTIYDEALANNLVSLQFPVKDVNNNGYAFIFDNCKLGVPKVVAGGMDTDVIMSIPFTAVAPDSSVDKMITIDRFGVAPA